ncbi:hypothetical protein SAMN02745866_02512 [Alteromonadaceae bacterium Bs31]|nr:hypothetical protein SAMN02745866_02512 [Alteromonadaceae bacterium Bs31]
MKIQKAIELFKRGELDEVEVELRRSPNNLSQWFILLRHPDGKSLMLADEDDRCVVDADIQNLLDLLKTIGFHQVMVIF